MFCSYSTSRPANTTTSTMTITDDTVHVQKLKAFNDTILSSNVDFGVEENTVSNTQCYRSSMGNGVSGVIILIEQTFMEKNRMVLLTYMLMRIPILETTATPKHMLQKVLHSNKEALKKLF